MLPTSTIFEFAGAGISLTVQFTSPLLPYSLDILSRPVTYVTLGARATDGRTHAVAFYVDTSAEMSVQLVTQQVVWQRSSDAKIVTSMHIGTQSQVQFGVVRQSSSRPHAGTRARCLQRRW